METHSYYQGSRDVYRYTDDFGELAATAGYTDPLVRVTKYRAGLDPWINVAITTSGTAPALLDYAGWRLRAFRQYDALARVRAGAPPTRAPAPAARPRTGTFLPVPSFMPAPKAAPAPALRLASRWTLTGPTHASRPALASVAAQLDTSPETAQLPRMSGMRMS